MTTQDRELYQQEETSQQAKLMACHGDVVTEEDFVEWRKQRKTQLSLFDQEHVGNLVREVPATVERITFEQPLPIK